MIQGIGFYEGWRKSLLCVAKICGLYIMIWLQTHHMIMTLTSGLLLQGSGGIVRSDLGLNLCFDTELEGGT